MHGFRDDVAGFEKSILLKIELMRHVAGNIWTESLCMSFAIKLM